MAIETIAEPLLSEQMNTLNCTRLHSEKQSQLDDAQCERDGFWDKHIVCKQPKPPVLSCDIDMVGNFLTRKSACNNQLSFKNIFHSQI